MARTHRNFGARRSARLTSWIGPADQGYISVADDTKVLIASASFTEPATIMRTRGAISVSANSFGVDVEFKGALGVGIVQTDALAAGVASIPGPWSDPAWGGWYVWRSFAYVLEFGDATGVRVISEGFEVDSKAMRKVQANEAIVVIAESQGGAFQIWDGMRTLVKLS